MGRGREGKWAIEGGVISSVNALFSYYITDCIRLKAKDGLALQLFVEGRGLH